jgi:photosystem II stability/assembly factor-like uncharacterized protein
MKFQSFWRLFGKRSQRRVSQERRLARRHTRPLLEPLEKRELLNNDAPFIKAVLPADGSTTSSNQPRLVVTFSEAVNEAEARSTDNYLLFNGSGKPVTITRADYPMNSINRNHQVELTYNNGVALPSDHYSLFVRGDRIHDVDDSLPLAQPQQLAVASGGLLDGNTQIGGVPTVSLVTLPGDGSTQAVTNFASNGTNPKPTAVALANLDPGIRTDDGRPIYDLLVANSSTNTINIFPGLPEGGFANVPIATLSNPSGLNPQALLVTDLNGDGLPDVVVAYGDSDNMTVYLNRGQRLFDPGTTYGAGRTPVGLAAADIDGDGKVDLIVVDNGPDLNGKFNVNVLLQDPKNAGKFLNPTPFDTTLTRPTGVAAGVLRPDVPGALADVVVTGQDGARVLFNRTASAGNPDLSQGPLLTAASTSAVAIGRIGNTGRPDIVATTKSNGGQALVFQNLGGGNFTSGAGFNANANATGLVLANVLGHPDGRLDILVANSSPKGTPGSLSVLLNRSGGQLAFDPPAAYTTDSGSQAVAVSTDKNGKVVQAVTANFNGADTSLVRARGDGTFSASTDIGLGAGNNPADAVVVGDLNGDNVPDIVIASSSSTSNTLFRTQQDMVTILLSQGPGKYAPPISFNVSSANSLNNLFGNAVPLQLALAPLTSPNRLDIVVANRDSNTVTILANSGTGSFTLLPAIPFTNTLPGLFTSDVANAIAVGDFDGDGQTDLVIAHGLPIGANQFTNQGLALLSGNGDRTFQPPREIAPIGTFGVFTQVVGLAASDFKKDGKTGLAVLTTETGGLGTVKIILQGPTKGTFLLGGTYDAGINPTSIAVGDLAGPGSRDLAVTNQSVLTNGRGNVSVTVLFNDGSGGFARNFSQVILDNTAAKIGSVAITNVSGNLYPAIVASLSGEVNNIVVIDQAGNPQAKPSVRFFATVGGGTARVPVAMAVTSEPFIRATTFTVPGTVPNATVSNSLIENGSFEALDSQGERGNLTGWKTYAEPGSKAGWHVLSSQVAPVSGLPVLPAPQGQFAAMLDEADAIVPGSEGPFFSVTDPSGLFSFAFANREPAHRRTASDYEGTHVLYQDFTIPDTATSVTLSMRLYIKNPLDPAIVPTGSFSAVVRPINSTGYSDTTLTRTLDFFPNTPNRPDNQQVRVDIVDPSLANLNPLDVDTSVLRNLYTTTQNTAGDDPTNLDRVVAWKRITENLTPLKGKTVRLRIAAANNLGRLIVGVDDVRVDATYADKVPPVINGLRLRNPGFGANPAQNFGGNTTDPTVVGKVSDMGSPNNIDFIAFDPTHTGNFTGPQAFRVTSLDPDGNFTATLPVNLPGIYTVDVEAVSKGGSTFTTSFTFNFQGPSKTAWQAVGPTSIRYSGQLVNYKTVAGKITSISVDPRDASGNVFYVGTDNGGVWKTTDGGQNWTPLTDFVKDPSGNNVSVPIASVAVTPNLPSSPSDSDTVYAATGSADNSPTSSLSNGILKSTDAGRTWTVVGQSFFAGAHISKMAVSRRGRDGNNRIYVAVAAGGKFGPGLYLSKDGGITWINGTDPAKMFLDNGQALGQGHALVSVTDVEIDRLSDFEEDIWIGMGNIGMLAPGDSAGVWTSANGGESWRQVVGGHDPKNSFAHWSPLNTNGPKSVISTKLPSATDYPSAGPLQIGKVLVTLAQDSIQDRSVVYVFIGRPPAGGGKSYTDPQQTSEINNQNDQSFGLFKTKNGGLSFTHVMLREFVNFDNVTPQWRNLFTLGEEATGVGSVVVDPTDPNVVYLGGSTRFDFVGSVAGTPGTVITLDGQRAHGLIRVDTRNMRDVDTFTPYDVTPPDLFLIENDGDDILKHEQGQAYPTGAPFAGRGYEGEGVFWYDIQTTDFGQQNIFYSAVRFDPQLRLPGTIHDLVFDPQGRLLLGTEGGIYRGVNRNWQYDLTTGGSGRLILPSVNTVVSSQTPFILGMDFTDLNGNLQIADTSSVAIDPNDRHTVHASFEGLGWGRSTGSLEWETTSLTNRELNVGSPIYYDGFALDGPHAGMVRAGPRAPNATRTTPSTIYRTFAHFTEQPPRFIDRTLQQIFVSRKSGEQGTFSLAQTGISVEGLDSSFQFPPLAVNSHKIKDINGALQDELMFGSNRVYEDDSGAVSWDQVSPVLGEELTALAFGPSGPDVFYAGTRSGHVFVDLRDGADGFPNRSTGLPAGAPINGLTVDPTDVKTAYAMVGIGTAGPNTGQKHVFRTKDGGVTWTSVSGNLPDVPAYAMVVDSRPQPGASKGKLYVGTEVGVFVSTDGGTTWNRLGEGLPNVPVVDLQFNQDFERLVAATKGRGVFQINTDFIGPKVVSIDPGNPTFAGLSAVQITFDKPVDPRTFTPAQVKVLFGPNGPITPLAINDLDTVDHMTYAITFLPQSTDGRYTLSIGPDIKDFLGNSMDQNGNQVNGEDPGDRFTIDLAVNSTDNGRFVSGLYHDLLSRRADVSGFLANLSGMDVARGQALQPVAQAMVTSPEGRGAFIYNGTTDTGLYRSLLNRPASTAEITIWVQALQQGATPEQVITAITGSDEYYVQMTVGGNDTGFVNRLYLDLLKRPADSGGLAAFLQSLSLSHEADRRGVMDMILRSDEYRQKVITSAYTTYLGRSPAPAELSFWLGQLQNGLTDEALNANLVASDEFFNKHGGNSASWLNAAYMALLGRPIDSASSQALKDQLQSGTQRLDITTALTASDEYRRLLIRNLFTKFLNRAPSDGEVAAFLGALQAGFTDEMLISLIVASAEYFQNHKGTETTQAGQNVNWINAAFHDTLGRNVDPAGQDTILKGLMQSERQGRAGAAQGFVNSDEYRRVVITDTYRTYLNRLPGVAELNVWLPLLQQGSSGPGTPSPREQFVAAVVGSSEYFMLQRDKNNLSTNTQWLTSLYQKVLGRSPDQDGLDALTSSLLRFYQPQRAAVVAGMQTSTEYLQSLVQSFFRLYLRRAPTDAELTARVKELQGGKTDEQFINDLLSSPEYFQSPTLGGGDNSRWLNQVFRDLFNRDRDAGSQGLLDLLNRGTPRSQIMTTLLNSPEYRKGLITKLYTTLLGRNPTPAEVTARLNAIDQGATDEQVAAFLLTSTEYFQRPHQYP